MNDKVNLSPMSSAETVKAIKQVADSIARLVPTAHAVSNAIAGVQARARGVCRMRHSGNLSAGWSDPARTQQLEAAIDELYAQVQQLEREQA